MAEKGPLITISFKTVSGLAAGKTQIKYHDIELGIVKRIEPTPDLSHVVVSAQMNKTAEPHLREGTHFWVVRPRLGITSLSGLETLVSGNYIEMDPGHGGGAERHFTGLEEPPVVRSDEPGTSYIVTTDKVGSISSGSPLFFRGIVVGEVIGYTFDGTQKNIPIRVFVKKPYDALIHDGTRFWNASGITVAAGASGTQIPARVHSRPCSAAASRSRRPTRRTTGEPAKATRPSRSTTTGCGGRGGLHRDASRALVEFEGSVRGLEIGAPVEALGIPIGRVVDFHLVVDAAAKTVRVPVVIEIDAARIGIVNRAIRRIRQDERSSDNLVALGLRAQLRTSSLITGSAYCRPGFLPRRSARRDRRDGHLPANYRPCRRRWRASPAR